MATTPAPAHRPKLAATASFIGSTVEYYDFYAYGAATALVFAPLFFSGLDPATAMFAAMATFGAAYLARPIGAIVFGHIGDRIGRKASLIATLLMMGVATFLIGLLPTYNQIGAAAPVLLLVMRLLQGFSAGGEWGGAVALSMEHANNKRRGFIASFTNSGALAGSVIASLVMIAVTTLPDDQFLAWGWRLPFLLSSVLVVIGLVLRSKLPEPPSFDKLKAAGQRERMPVITVLKDHWKTVLQIVGCSGYVVVSTIAGVFALSYALQVGAATATVVLVVKLLSTTTSVFTQPLFGLAADRFGRRPVFAIGALGCAAATFLLFWAIGEHNLPMMFIGHWLLVGIAYSMPNGVAPVMFSEMFATPVRYTGVALSSQLGQLFAGFAPAVAAALVVAADGGWILVAIATAVACVVSAVSTLTMRETSHVSFDQLGAPTHEHAAAAPETPTPATSGRA
jgi:MFS family permease